MIFIQRFDTVVKRINRLQPEYFKNIYYALQFLKKLPYTQKLEVMKQKYSDMIKGDDINLSAMYQDFQLKVHQLNGGRQNRENRNKNHNRARPVFTNRKGIKCFKCDGNHHLADCPHDEFKCFKCNQYGHKAVDCDQPRRKSRGQKKKTIPSMFCGKDLTTAELKENESLFILDSGSAEQVVPATIR